MAANLSFAPGIAFSGTPVPQYGPNMLSPSQSGFEDGTTAGWSSYNNASVSNNASQAYTGTRSLQVTATATGDAIVYLAGPQFLLPSAGNAGSLNSYVVGCAIKANTTPRNAYIGVQFSDRTQTYISSANGVAQADNTATWTFMISNIIAPVNAIYLVPLITIQAAAASEIHWIDAITIVSGIYYPS